MASIDWNTVAKQAIAAAAASLGATWNAVAPAAQHSIELLVMTAQYIAANAAQLDADDQKLLTDNQQLAMQNVLLGYQAIGTAAAEQAVAAAWGIVQTALATAIKVA